MPRGGSRQGKPGAAYSNRTDLNAGPRIAAPTNQPYGTAGAQIAAQQAVPMSAPPPIPLSSPTARPNEPVQAGLPSGPGPGPSVNPAATPDPVEAQLRGLYYQFPNRDLASLLEMIDRGQTF